MAPNSSIIILRHAQAEHNVLYDYSSLVHDAPPIALGREQAASLSRRVSNLQQEADLVVTSPLRRTLQTRRIGWAPAVEWLGGVGSVICLPELQECNDYACDRGSSREELGADPEFVGFNLERLTPEWTSKKGFWGFDQKALGHRAKKVRQFLRERSEKNIVLVAHGGIIRRIVATPAGPSSRTWWNAEVRIFQFSPEFVENEDCWLCQTEGVAVMGGYGPTGAEIDISQISGNVRMLLPQF